MARLVGYMANRGDALARVLEYESADVHFAIAPGTSGWGVGFYQGSEVLYRRRPRWNEGEFSWSAITGDIHTDCAILHVRCPTVGDLKVENTHPFRLRNWLFAHDGTLENFAEAEEGLRASIPDFLRRNIRGQTDSEVFFHIVMAALHNRVNIDHIDIPPHEVVASLYEAHDVLREHGIGSDSGLNATLTNGRFMVAYCAGGAMGYLERKRQESVMPGNAKRRPEEMLRYVLIASGDGAAEGFARLQDRQALIVHRSLNVELCSR